MGLSYIGEYSLPWNTRFDGVPFGGISGLDYDPSTGHYWANGAAFGRCVAGMETALQQDGPVASLTQCSLARFIRYDAKTGQPSAKYVYPVSPIPQSALQPPYASDNGVSEILALDDHRLLVTERSYASGYGSFINVFMADIAGATNVLPLASLSVAAPILCLYAKVS